MKNFTFSFIASLFIFSSAIAQVPGACGKNNLPKINNGSTTLGQTYSNTACGLNYVQGSALIETRYNSYTTNGTLGTGLPTTITISGIPNPNNILQAYVWYLVSYTEATAPSTTVTLTNPSTASNSYQSTIVGTDVSKCWGETGTAVYRTDVTSIISGNGNYGINISGFSNASWEVDGATLFIIYKDQSANYQGSLNIWDGAMATSSGGMMSQTMTGFNVCSTPSSARAFAISSDHQDNIAATHPATLNGVASNFPNSMFNFDEASATLTSGQTSSAFGESDGGFGDCYLWGAMGLYYQTTNCAVCSPCLTTTVQIDSVKNISSCTSNDGAIYISDSTTAPPLTFSWSNGATTENVTGLSTGTYSVIVTDSSGCSNTFSATILSPSAINITADTIVTVSCNGPNVGEINVSVSGGNSPYTFNWSNGATTQNISSLANGTYTVTVTDAAGCTAVSSVSDAAISNLQSPDICMVTVDSLSQNNIIMWDKTSYTQADSFIVYREISTNNYQPIGEVPYNALSLYVDTVRTLYFPNTGDPNIGTYRYKLGLVDSCTNRSMLGLYHNTIYMINNSGAFYWSQLYTIESSANPVNSYVLMRDDYSNGNWHAVASVAGTQQTVIDTAYTTYQNTASWRVATQWNISCTPTIKNPNVNNFISSLSNIYKTSGAGVNEISLNDFISIYPNPTNGEFSIQVNSEGIKGEYKIQIQNVLGETVFEKTSTNKQETINLTGASGIYFLKIKNADGIGVKKIIKE